MLRESYLATSAFITDRMNEEVTDRLMELPSGVLGVALGTILLPTLRIWD